MIEKVARIIWLSAERGGRMVPPSGPRYIAPVRFFGVQHEIEAWSLVADLVSRSTDSMEWVANVRFLVEEAPHELLADGARFELYEGKRCVAYGTIVSGTVPVEHLAHALVTQETGR